MLKQISKNVRAEFQHIMSKQIVLHSNIIPTYHFLYKFFCFFFIQFYRILLFQRLTSIESVMPSSHLILCRPFLLLPPIPPSIRVFSNESTLRKFSHPVVSFSDFGSRARISYVVLKELMKEDYGFCLEYC